MPAPRGWQSITAFEIASDILRIQSVIELES
uniref:Uncharacterized protein n=1 Tax=Arundo donax TaxID=35708 RepID=A0A0A9EMM7_ARUDO